MIGRSLAFGRRQRQNPLVVSELVKKALTNDEPVVALESTIITHGMPFPQNLETALQVQDIIKNSGATPATVAVLNGKIRVGLSDADLEYLARTGLKAHKTSRRDFPHVLSSGLVGATTVSGTMVAAHMAGIDVFVTGGIGGVHRGGESSMDVSADLTELGQTPVTVVCAGVKSILDIGRTLEYLETQGVPVVTLGETSEFPAFYTPKSGFKSPFNLKSTVQCAEFINQHINTGLKNGIVIGVPIPESGYAELHGIEEAIQQALISAEQKGIRGAAVTPFVLDFIARFTQGKSLAANITLVKNNAEVGANIARELALLGRISSGKKKSLESVIPDQTQKKRVVVFGGATVDVLGTLDDANTLNSNQGKVFRGFGGVGRNVAECIHRFGNSVLMVSAIGKDSWGQSIKQNMETLGMSTKGIIESSTSPTAVYNSIANNQGKTLTSISSMSIFDDLRPTFISFALPEIRNADFVVIDANIPVDTMGTIAESCQKAGVPLWFETTSRYKCTKAVAAKILPLLSFISPTITELEELARALDYTGSSRDTKECSRHLFKFNPKLTIIVHSQQGVELLTNNGGMVECKSFSGNPNVPVVSRNGAGDTLAGAIISSLIRGRSLEQSIRVGIKAAEETIQFQESVAPTIDPSLTKVA